MSKHFNIFTDMDPAGNTIDAAPFKRECVSMCESHGVSCPNTDCKNWMDFEEDLNCALVAVDKNPSGMTLREIGERLAISFVRVCQIERAATEKLKKRMEKPVSGK
tara:strand:+ start:18604 stop:18921 length:318 start_codon:yes stop_codon:yes gene_type:complete